MREEGEGGKEKYVELYSGNKYWQEIREMAYTVTHWAHIVEHNMSKEKGEITSWV